MQGEGWRLDFSPRSKQRRSPSQMSPLWSLISVQCNSMPPQGPVDGPPLPHSTKGPWQSWQGSPDGTLQPPPHPAPSLTCRHWVVRQGAGCRGSGALGRWALGCGRSLPSARSAQGASGICSPGCALEPVPWAKASEGKLAGEVLATLGAPSQLEGTVAREQQVFEVSWSWPWPWAPDPQPRSCL